MTVLVLGATGNTGRPLAGRLLDRGIRIRTANRHPVGDGVRFDWSEPAGFRAVLDGVRGIYLVPPPGDLEPMRMAGSFLAEAHAAGVRRVVLLGSLAEFPDVPGIDELRQAVRGFEEWAELRPSGFMQNLLSGHPAGEEIRTRGQVRSATGDGRVGWIDAEDIAAVAAEVLTRDTAVNDELILTGPEALGYDEVASIFTDLTGRPIRHLRVSVSEMRQRNLEAGMPAPFATALAEMERRIAHGSEDRVSDVVRRLTGAEPRSLRAFVRTHLGKGLDERDPVERDGAGKR